MARRAVDPAVNVGLKAVGDHLLSVAGIWFWALLLLICLVVVASMRITPSGFFPLSSLNM